jgi:hypothetical protein
MPAKKKAAKKSMRVRDLKPSKDAKGGTGPQTKPGYGGGDRKHLY